jgi:hypothetical protein
METAPDHSLWRAAQVQLLTTADTKLTARVGWHSF